MVESVRGSATMRVTHVKGGAHARRRSPASRDVELPCAGAAGAAGPSAPPDPRDGRRDPGRAVPRVREALLPGRSPVDPAGEAVARPAAAGPLQHAERAPADGATGLQPALSLVRRPEAGCPRLGCYRVHEESRAAPGRRYRPGLL